MESDIFEVEVHVKFLKNIIKFSWLKRETIFNWPYDNVVFLWFYNWSVERVAFTWLSQGWIMFLENMYDWWQVNSESPCAERWCDPGSESIFIWMILWQQTEWQRLLLILLGRGWGNTILWDGQGDVCMTQMCEQGCWQKDKHKGTAWSNNWFHCFLIGMYFCDSHLSHFWKKNEFNPPDLDRRQIP